MGDDPHGYLPRAEIEEHIRTYAAGLPAEVRSGTRVDRLRPAEAGGYVLDTADGPIAAPLVLSKPLASTKTNASSGNPQRRR